MFSTGEPILLLLAVSGFAMSAEETAKLRAAIKEAGKEAIGGKVVVARGDGRVQIT
jgi:hypothetical protein